ncbi:2'-5' RNA ligase family protein [Bhargavaea cecembensis]|uniref:2'-5' RNA ligase family protein n=1 Tax=Bhargavaea cecembensis TaxID=394098 RepID=UPI00058E5EE0|nr:2'-5' RNA ligase family protein [Bhargavaea cecembensis]
MKYGIVAFPSRELQDQANAYRKRYDPHYALIPPHMTILGPFEIENKSMKEASDELLKVAAKHKPFELNVTKVSTFAPVTNAIYYKVEPNEGILALREALDLDFIKEDSKHQYVPHITIAQKMSSGEHDDIIGQIKMAGMEHTETIDRVHLLYQLENGMWSAYETFTLSGDE